MAYVWNGVRRHAAIFVKDGSSNFVYAFNYSPVDYQNFFNWAYGAGYRQTSLYVAEVSGGESMGGEFYALPGSWPVHWGLSAAQYQQVFSDYDSKGYQLYKVQGYNNSRTYDAIWLK
ncbi:MAG: hypothetical protein HY074_04980 [Deltaproteobacteria bacterium]|nr:hypothetical protein [Deltaproteobacteria bacterium]